MTATRDRDTYDLLVDGESVPAAAAERFETVDPATGEPIAAVARARAEDIGPVLSVIEFSTEAEATELANDTDYGLVAGIHTQDVGRAHRFARDVEAGQVYVNEWFAGGEETLFGGVKKSGFGREKGLAAVDAYTELKNVCANISPN